MNFFVFILVWFAFIFWLNSNQKFLKKYPERKEVLIQVLMILPLAIFAAFRNNFQHMGDTMVYVNKFNGIPNDFMAFLTYLGDKTEPILCIVGYICKLFSNNINFIFFCFALLFLIPVNLFCKKFSENYMLSMFLFVTGGTYFSWCCNGIKQGLAIALIIISTPLFIQKKYWVSVGVLLVATLIHNSAIIFLPFMFICLGSAFNKKTLWLLVIIGFVMLYFNELSAALINKLGTDSAYLDELYYYSNFGAKIKIINAVFYSVPMILSVLCYKSIKNCKDPLVNFVVNMSVVCSIFSFLGAIAGASTFGRVMAYFVFYNYLLLPWMMNHLVENNRLRIFLTLILISVYIVHYCIDMNILLFQVHIPWEFFVNLVKI